VTLNAADDRLTKKNKAMRAQQLHNPV